MAGNWNLIPRTNFGKQCKPPASELSPLRVKELEHLCTDFRHSLVRAAPGGVSSCMQCTWAEAEWPSRKRPLAQRGRYCNQKYAATQWNAAFKDTSGQWRASKSVTAGSLRQKATTSHEDWFQGTSCYLTEHWTGKRSTEAQRYSTTGIFPTEMQET